MNYTIIKSRGRGRRSSSMITIGKQNITFTVAFREKYQVGKYILLYYDDDGFLCFRFCEERKKISKRYPNIPFDNLSRIARYFVKWQEKRMADAIKTAEDHAFLAGAEWENEKDKDSIIDAYVCESFNPVSEQGGPNFHGVTIIYEDEGKPYLLAGNHVKLKILK